MKPIGRLLRMGKNCAAMNMAIDEVILTAQKEQPNPTLRFYDWTKPAFSFGYFQDIALEVDVDACRSQGIELVKRMTGGGTVVHGWDLTYTLILPRQKGELSVKAVYQLLGRNLVKAFEQLSIPATCYGGNDNYTESTQNICLTNPAENDVMCNGKKVAGVSVRRNRNGMMFQGYISLDVPIDPILKMVSIYPEVQQMVVDSSAAINTNGRLITRNSLTEAICETFELNTSFHSEKLSLSEIEQADKLVKTKYTTAVWNYS